MTAYGLASNRSRPWTGRRRWTAPRGGWAARRCSCPPSARQRARLDAVPCLSSLPPGAHAEGTGAAALCPCGSFLSHYTPPGGFADRLLLLANRDCRPCACRGAGGARACRTRRWRWQVDRVGATCPHAPRASLRSQGRSSGLSLAGLCTAGHRWRARAPSPHRQPWQRGPWPWPAPGSRTRLPIAAALFLPPQYAQCNPGGATSRAGLAALGAHAHP
jgi:hypothetical protein